MASDFNEDLIIKQIQALNDTNKFYDILSLISNSNSSHLHFNTTEALHEEVSVHCFIDFVLIEISVLGQ